MTSDFFDLLGPEKFGGPMLLPWHLLGRLPDALAGLSLLLVPPLAAQKVVPSRPVLEKNAFFLSSAGFKVQFANDPATKKLMTSLPSHQFVVHAVGATQRYLYADPNVCVCVYVGDGDAYRSYRDMMTSHLKTDNVAPDYGSEVNMLLREPVSSSTLDNPVSFGDFFRQDF
jgi:hypothetical protein